jgi:N-acetylmuramoyl-L-alanine amidase
MREALNGRTSAQRTRREYQRVIDSYRRIYFGSPASSKADPSVVASAELMVEMGRHFDDTKILRGAIEQYKFLRKEYPGSRYRYDALFTIGEIYKDDLNDSQQARAIFNDFLHRYPQNRLVDDARAAIHEMDADAQAREHPPARPARNQRSPKPKAGPGTVASNSAVSGALNNDSGPQSEYGPQPIYGPQPANSSLTHRDALPRVTGVRHWSTPDYTRVAIDVEQEVKFGSQRISHPDRIFFDLRDTRLASTLVGKTFDVDDGFLRKIRVAEAQPGRTRIVLEVDDLASYDAFLLPDPYRLIIDIHGKKSPGESQRAAANSDPSKVDSAVDTGSEPAAAVATSSAPEVSDDTADSTPRTPSSNLKSTSQPAIHFSETGIETDLPPSSATPAPRRGSTKSSPAKTNAKRQAKPDTKPDAATDAQLDDEQVPDAEPPANGVGVIKTTVAVKGSTRRIPKTIVEAEDHAPSKVAAIDHKKVKFEKAPDDAALPATHDSLVGRDATREARPMAAGDRSLIRALGLKIGRIVIDAGHGGHDTGTIGPNGLLEKDVVLDVAKRLGRLLETRLGAEVVYTRRDDTFIPLETRTAIANRERADLFISIHANSSHDADARGVETYYLNFTSSPQALEVAARENAVSEKSIHELQDLVKKIALKEKIDESREFAGDVQESLYGGLSLNNVGVRNRGIKKAPFIVLIGANMPSILAEISFVSNPTDERKLETAEHRQRIAESLYRGVAKYAGGLSGIKVASKIDKPEGQ